VVTSMSR